MSKQVLPAEYDNRVFSSKTEARWVKFFNEIRTAYEYEIEAYSFSNGVKYYPDIYLPELGLWIEPKNPEVRQIQSQWMAVFQKAGTLAKEDSKPVLVLYGLPEYESYMRGFCNWSELYLPFWDYHDEKARDLGIAGFWQGRGQFCLAQVEAINNLTTIDGEVCRKVDEAISYRWWYKHADKITNDQYSGSEIAFRMITWNKAGDCLHLVLLPLSRMVYIKRRWYANELESDHKFDRLDIGICVDYSPNPPPYRIIGSALMNQDVVIINKLIPLKRAYQGMLSLKFANGKAVEQKT